MKKTLLAFLLALAMVLTAAVALASECSLADWHVLYELRGEKCPECGYLAVCEHEDTYTDTMEANCSVEGYIKVICNDCGETISAEELPTNDNHFFYNGKCMKCGAEEACKHENTSTDTLDANCSAEGYIKVICNDCDETVSEEILPTNDSHFFYNGKCMKCGTEEACKHNWEVVKEQAANCIEAAYVWEKCSKCGDEKNGEIGKPNGEHDYVIVKELAATCIEPAYVWKECSVCGAEKNHEVGEADGEHDYEVVKELAATCIEPAYVWKECTVCGAEENHEVGEADGEHDYEVVKELAATCIEPAYVWKECSVCGAEKNHEVGEADGEHDYEVVKELAATCIEPAYVWKECTVCGAEKNHEVGEADGEHDYVIVKELAATCLERGYVWKECSLCGAEKNHEVGDEPAGEHGETYKDILEANCSAEGYSKEICQDCGEVVSEEVLEKNDVHFFYNGICQKCGAEEVIPCEHNYEVVKELAPNCIEAGYVWLECSVCGAEKNHEVGEPNGEHTYENGICKYCGDEEPTQPEIPEVPVVPEQPEVPEQPVEPEVPSTYYYNNTMTSFGPTTRELVGGSAWHRVTPVDLSVDGVYTYDLIASNRYVVGTVTIKVEAGFLTVSYRVKANPCDVEGEELKLYASKADLAEGKAVAANVDEAINIAETFGTDTKIIVSLILTGDYDTAGHNVTVMYADDAEIADMIANID